MTQENLKTLNLPDEPGVYKFLDAKEEILYIGKATSLRDRVRSYFGNDLLHTRGKHIVDMVTLAHTVRHVVTDSVLEAIVLEASLIKQHQPHFNTKEKDNKSWNYVVITKEEYPAVQTIRERNLMTEEMSGKYLSVYGPFPSGANLQEALKIVRKIFPFRDTCTPLSGKPCFNAQIGLCPRVCIGEMSIVDYRERIKEIQLFFEGKKRALLSRLNKTMHAHAKKMEFETAGEYKRMMFALRHINDASLISEEVRVHSQKTSRARAKPFRIEAYDIAHISGKYTVGVMTVCLDGVPHKSAYRKFKIRILPDQSNDTLHLEEVLRRRFAHAEWQAPDLVVMDGGVAQKRRAEKVLKELGKTFPIVSVLKDARHKAKAILGNREIAESYKKAILIANMESHRFAVAYHRQLREKLR
jgi:excinuclease ABC subunit C